MYSSNYFKDFIQSENNNTNINLKTIKNNESKNNINNGYNSTTNQNSNNMNFNSVTLKSNLQDKKISQNKIIGQGMINGLNNLKSLDSSKGTVSSRNINGKKFTFNEKSEKTDELKSSKTFMNKNGTNEDKSNNLNRFTKIGKDPKLSTKNSDKVKNIFSSKIADN